ncbi:outer membrane autotransporter protein [Variovorax boronicumulans]|uniref:autotransporter-associated beta strand repeat-containing protein n=1 Tax=Variovorax boronicumulans TaxID=436515 RepID=UPI002788D982|nr:autotransporter-associated beta strand repeat-containing protein [Variovorax boronicumulans]MDP9992880.1 outer membrane autotransporter protein [Variovorax boronicumulans]MDQ0004029.1 outer membrane autotransporter protein [Variovorax boronicumulans]
MNTAYKTIWNAAIGAWVAVSEATCARGKRSTSRRAGRTARLAGPLLAATGFAMTLPAWSACAPAAPADGDAVSCTGVPILLPPNPNSFFSNANGLYVTVQPGAIMSTLPGGTAMTLGGTGVTLTNLSAIDANAAGSLVLARALAMGNLLTPGSGALAVNNEGSIEGTFDGTFSLNGAAMVIANQGKTTVNNAGAIGLAPLGLLTPANGMAIGIYGGGNVDFTNAKTGTITGRIAFEGAATGGNRFVNAGTINGSVSLGAGASSDTFIAVTGSSVSSGGVSLPGLAVPTPAGTSLGFAAGGTVDAGAGGADTLTLRNVAFGPGSGNAGSGTIAASQYLNFENLQVDSGTWTLNGAVASGSALLYGGVAIFDDAGAFGTGTLTGNGGAMQAAVNGLTLAQNVNLTGGLFVQGANDLTLGGTVSGAAGLIKNGTGTLTLNGINNFSGGFALNGGGLTLGNASALGTGLFLVGGNVALNTGFTGTLNNQVHLNGALTLDGTGTLTFGNAISGAGSLTVNGSNLALAASNTYGGGTTLGGGRLDVGSNTALGTGDLTINGASVLTGAAGVALANNVVLNSTLNFGAGGSGGALTLNGAISGAGGISLAGAPGLTLNGASTFTGGFNIGGGALTVGNDSALGLGSVTVSGASSLDSNKTVSLTNNLNLNAALTIGGSNDLALNGAIGGLRGLTKNGTGRLTLGSANTFFGGVNLQGGALRVGTNTSLGLGTLTVNGNAALDASANVNLGNAVVLNAGLDIGGANNIGLGGVITGTGPLSYSGSGTLTLANANFWTGGTTLKSGTLNVGNNFALGQGALAVTGNANLRANVPGTLLGNALTLGAGTTLNVDGSNPLALVGTIDGGGALALSGLGAVALAGANTYSGGTTVSGTTLGVINPTGSATGSGAVLVQAGGALTGNGSIAGTVSVGDGIVLPGNGSAGTLTVGGLNLASGSILNYDLGQAGVAGGALNDLISVNGNLQLDGTLNVSETAGGKFGAGLYRLIDYTGTLTDNGLNIGTAPTDSKNLQVQTSIANQVNLVNFDGATLNLWDGGNPANFNDGKIAGGSGTWRAGGSTANWTSVDGKLNAGWQQDGVAIFAGQAGTVTVDNTGAGGAVRIGGAQFATDGYLVNGDALTISASDTTVRVGDGTAASAGMTAIINAAIVGAGGLVKDDGGTLVLGAANSYTGGTTIKSGTLQISSDANLGTAAGGLALEGGATLRVTGDTASTRVVSLGAGVDTFDIDPIRTLALNGVVTGAGSLRKTGAGTLQLGAANFYAGGTEVAAGSLEALVTGALGAGPVSVADNASLAFANSAEAGKLAITVAARGGAPTDNGGFVAFRDSSSAGNATITTNKGASVEFRDSSSAGNAVIENRGGLTTLWFNATAGKAQITNFDGGRIDLLDDASAGQARLVNESGGAISFFDRTSADQATVVNNAGAQLGIGSLTNAGLSIGSLEGAGSVLLGSKALTTGGLNTSTTVSGTISGTGGSVVKVGSGTLTLSGANTYTGGTTVAAGTLAANNTGGSATGTGAVQVQGGATLAGTGAVAGTVTIAKGGILSAGNGGAGTLTTGSLNLAAGAVLDYELGQAGTAGGALNDLVKVNGNLQLDGTLDVAQSKGGVFGAGIYRLIDYTGTLTDNGLDIGSAPVASKDLQVQTSVAQQVNLVNRAGLALNFWDGGDAGKYNDGKIAGGSGTWRVGVPGDGWTGADGKINAAWVQDQFAVFGGTGGTVNVSNAGGTVRITGAQFAADGYVLQGDAIELGASGTVVRVGDGSGTDTTRSATLNVALTGTGGLVKDDVGTLVLGGANTYTGGTTVKAGVLQGGTASLQGDIVNNAEVAFDQGTTAGTYAGTMSGTGKLRKIGSGTLVLGSANSHAGGTFVDAGTLATDVTGALGSGAANVATGATLQLGGGFDAGTTAIGNQGTVRLQDKSSAGASTITNAAGGVLDFAGDASADKATVINQAGAQVRIDQATTGVSFGALSGAGETVLGAKALTLGGSGGDNTLSGSISGTGGSVVKVGAGTLVLTGANTYTGATTVAAGTLRVNNTSGSGTGTGAVQVQSGATLAGSGSIAGAVTIAKGGILAAGNSPGTLTLGALTLAGGSTLNYELGQAGVPGGALNDLINVTGNLQLDGTLNIAQSAGGTFGPGLYRLMSYGGTFTDNGLDIGTAPAGAKLADLQVQTSVANQVNLVNRAGLSLNFWDGGDSSKYNDGQVAGGSGTWRVGSPQPSQDGWTDMDGKLNANWAQNQFAVFGGKAGTVTVDGGGGAVRIAGAQFAVDGYTVQGDGITLDNANSVIRVGDGTAAGANMTATMNVALSGTGGISKEDAGRLILGGANTYTGGTTVKGGVLQGSATSLQGSIVNNAEVAFDQDKTAGIYAGVMSGTGKLRKIGAGTLTLASANSYSGGTLVDAGTLATDTSGALGTGAVSIASGAALQFGGKADAGKLAIANQGTLRLQDGANAASATVTNAAGAQVRIDLATTGASIGALGGAGDVVLGAKALTTGAIGSDSTISGAITGAGGSLVKVGAGTLTLAGTASYSGETRVAAGTLKAGAANAFSAASSAVVASGATLNLAGFSQTVAGLANSGTVALAGAAPGTTLTVKGNYVGNNGVLKLGTVLNGGAGPSDRLVIDGGAASGKTSVQIANIGGLGARTSGAGIEVVSARNGATTTAQTTKDAFVLAGGHVDAGAFEYRLHAGDASGGGENWYLRTEAEPGTPGNPGGTGLPAYRAEASLFAALPNQLRQSNLGMLASRSQRVGDDDVRGGASSGASRTSSGTDGSYRRAWGRLISTDMDIRQGGTVSPHSEGRVTGLQAGTDLWANPDWRAGIYVGQLDGDTRVRGVGSGLLNSATGRNDLRSQYLGLYGTFATEDGFYADAVLQAGRHRYTVQPLLSGGVEGKGNSFLASIEVGKAFAIGSGGWSVEPQLQLIHQRLRLDDVSIPGALVQQDADSGWIGRAGVRIKGSFATGVGTLQPYARVNVYRSAKGNDVARFVNPAAITPVGAPIGGTSTELAAGFTLSVSQRTSLYGELGKQWASGGDARVGSSINAAAGVRVKW